MPFFAGYFALLLGIATVRTRRMQGMSDYVLAGRRLGRVTAVLSASSSTTSGWTVLVLPALAFSNGLSELLTIGSIAALFWLGWKVMAAHLRRYTIAAGDSLTLPQFLEHRFSDRTGAIRTLTASISLFFIFFLVASGLIAGSKLPAGVFGTGPTAGVLFTLLAIASYTFMGGFLVVSRTDVLQAVLMTAVLLIIPVLLLGSGEASIANLGNLGEGY